MEASAWPFPRVTRMSATDSSTTQSKMTFVQWARSSESARPQKLGQPAAHGHGKQDGPDAQGVQR